MMKEFLTIGYFMLMVFMFHVFFRWLMRIFRVIFRVSVVGSKEKQFEVVSNIFSMGRNVCWERGEGGMKRENEKFHVNINQIRIFLFVKIAIIVTFGEDNQIIQGFVVWSWCRGRKSRHVTSSNHRYYVHYGLMVALSHIMWGIRIRDLWSSRLS